MKRDKVVIIGLSAVLLAVIILGVFFGCSACSSAAERKRLAELEAQRIEEEAARLEAERLEAERLEAARLEAERLAAEAEEAARLERERLEAERLAAEARRRAAAGNSSGARQTYQSTESNPDHPLVGVWSNANEAIIFRIRNNGGVEVLNYTLVDEMVEVYWRTNRAITGGGFYDTRNPEAFESTYTGTGTYTATNNSVTFKLDMKNHLGTTKTVNHTSRFSLNADETNLRLTSGLPRRFIINKDTKAQFDTKDFVTTFTRK